MPYSPACGLSSGGAKRSPSSVMMPDSSRAIEPSQPSASMSRPPRAARAKTRSRSWLGHERRVGAADVLVALLLGGERRAARGALGRHDEGALGAVAQVDDGPDDLGDDVAGLAQHDGVADEHALALDLVGVVQRRLLDGRAGDDDGLHDAVRGDPAGAADVDPDVEELGVDLLGRVLEGDGPARRPRRRAELALERDLVDLDDDAVDLVGTVVAVLAVVGHELLARPRCRRARAPRRRWAAPRRAGRHTPRSGARRRSRGARRCRGRACAAAGWP